MVEVGANVVQRDGEIIGEALPWLDGVLADAGDAILIGRNLQPVPVDGGALREMVGDGDAYMIASRYADGRARDRAVQCPGEHARMPFDRLPHDLLSRKMELFRAIGGDGVLSGLRAIVLSGVGDIA